MIDVLQDGSHYCVILQLCCEGFSHWIRVGKWLNSLEEAQASANEYRKGK